MLSHYKKWHIHIWYTSGTDGIDKFNIKLSPKSLCGNIANTVLTTIDQIHTNLVHFASFRMSVQYTILVFLFRRNLAFHLQYNTEISCDGMLNLHNWRHYCHQNPFITQNSLFLTPVSLNVWLGMLGDSMMGPHVFQ